MPDTRLLTRGRIPDPMGARRINRLIDQGMEMCYDLAPGGDLVCTRPDGHSRRHAASDGYDIVAVWER